MRPLPLAALALALALVATSHAVPARAQYNPSAGRSAPTVATTARAPNADGTVTVRSVQARPAADRFGNASGNQFDLARDGAFQGQTVAVLHFYTGSGFDFSLPAAALREKGFSVYRWSNGAPPVAELRAGLARASQLWVISGERALLGEDHLRAIQDFFEAGHGVYIWGDNDPYYADANAVARRLLGASMDGNLPGEQVVNLRFGARNVGITPDHLISTGLEWLYEGHTVATVHPSSAMQPLLYGSAGNLVAAFYDHDGRRAILDGGFTRLYMQWDTAGTARYVKNAAAWLANAERFGPGAVPSTSR
ncbi:MAG: hypothetical protein WCJ30_01075 [Deltaproteobacteria bacterium]